MPNHFFMLNNLCEFTTHTYKFRWLFCNKIQLEGLVLKIYNLQYLFKAEMTRQMLTTKFISQPKSE